MLGLDHIEQFAPTCPYDGTLTVACTGKEIYPNHPITWGQFFFRCPTCKAYVGTHEASGRPLGSPANRELRKARMDAHAAFDPLWKTKAKSEGISQGAARGLGYAWLARELKIPVDDCHIGGMTIEQCREVLRIVKASKGRVRNK